MEYLIFVIVFGCTLIGCINLAIKVWPFYSKWLGNAINFGQVRIPIVNAAMTIMQFFLLWIIKAVSCLIIWVASGAIAGLAVYLSSLIMGF